MKKLDDFFFPFHLGFFPNIFFLEKPSTIQAVGLFFFYHFQVSTSYISQQQSKLNTKLTSGVWVGLARRDLFCCLQRSSRKRISFISYFNVTDQGRGMFHCQPMNGTALKNKTPLYNNCKSSSLSDGRLFHLRPCCCLH